jgi:2-methylcitrate dehydratase
MTLKRDLAWTHLGFLDRSSIAYQYSRYALGLQYGLLPEKVIHQAKRCVLDAAGCAIGAYFAPARTMYEAMIKEVGGVEEATVIGSGLRTTAANATLVNSLLVRFLDYNDLGGGGHNSDSIPAIIAVAERQKSSGRDFLTSVICSYELGGAFSKGMRGYIGHGLGMPGFIDTRGGLTMPPTLGRLMGLNEDQIANACGICASHSQPLGALDADREENSMSKSMRFGFIAYDAILSLLLAKQGFTGPVRIVEGQNGINQAIFQGHLDIEQMVDFTGWHIMNVVFKPVPSSWGLNGCILATLALVRENHIQYQDVAEAQIFLGEHNVYHHTTAAKKYARNAESADHSAYYGNAVAIKYGRMGPDLFEEKYINDPDIWDLVEKMTVNIDPGIPSWEIGGKSIIIMKNGQRFEKLEAHPHGGSGDPLTDSELETKFMDMAVKYMGRTQAQKLMDTIWNLEKVTDMSQFTKLLVFPKKGKQDGPTPKNE